jgi:hypothetical protein
MLGVTAQSMWCNLVCVCQLCCPRKLKVSRVPVVIVAQLLPLRCDYISFKAEIFWPIDF